jgi:anti-anti-sigma factor
MISFSHDTANSQLTVHFIGRLDTLSCPGIQSAFNDKFSEIRKEGEQTSLKVVFDMQEVTFISSSFIRICLTTFHSCGRGNFAIINCDPFLKKAFKIAGLDDLLAVS